MLSLVLVDGCNSGGTGGKGGTGGGTGGGIGMDSGIGTDSSIGMGGGIGTGGTSVSGTGGVRGIGGMDGGGAPASGWGESCANEVIPATGVYYFCNCAAGAAAECVAGNDDSGAGTQASPWRSWTKVNSTWKRILAGETVALCRGGAWDITTPSDDSAWTNHGTATAPVTMRDYASLAFASSAKPLLFNGGFNLRQASNLRFLNLAMMGPGPHPSWAMYSGTGQSNWTVCNLAIDDFSVGMNIPHENAVTQVRILGNTFDGNTMAFMGGAPGLLMDGNIFTNNGISNDTSTHSIYFSGGDDMRIVNNIIYGISSGGSAFVGHGYLARLTIENNVLDQTAGPSGWSWDLSGGGYSNSHCGLPGLVFRRNRSLGVENVGVRIEGAFRAIIEDNIIHMSLGPGDGIVLPGECTCGNGCEVTTNVTVRNNTIYLPHGGAGILMEVGSDNYVVNNVIDGVGHTCFRGEAYAMEDYNLCTGTWGRTAGEHDLTTAPRFVGPLTPAGSANLTPAEGSPLLDAGSPATTCTVGGVANQPCSSGLAANAPLWSATDTAKTRAGSPDIGAFERD